MRRTRILALTTLSLIPLGSVPAQIVAPKNPPAQANDQAAQPAAPPAPVLSAEDIARTMMPGVVLIRCEGRRGGKFGSGFFVRPGVVVTNHHVVENMMRGTVQLTVSAADATPPTWRITEIIAIDEEADLALLAVPGATRAERPSLPFITTLDKINIGQKVYALGNPEGLTGTISEGIVSANLRKGGNIHFVQLTAPISPGSSGGPVINTRGEVIGVAVGALSEGQNLNFAIAAPSILPLLEKLDPKKRGRMILGGDLPDDWRIPAPPEQASRSTIAVQQGGGARRATKPPASTPTNPPSSTRTQPRRAEPVPPAPSEETSMEGGAEAGYLGYGDTIIVSSLGRLDEFARRRQGALAVLGGLKINALAARGSGHTIDVTEVKTKVRNAGQARGAAYFEVTDSRLLQEMRDFWQILKTAPVQLHFRVQSTSGSTTEPIRCLVYGITWFDDEGRARGYFGRQ
jgi:S1-C subfamily serine protease